MGRFECVELSLSLYVHECETWSLTLSEQNRLRVFEYRVLREMFGSKKEELAEGWGKLRSEELQGWYWTAR